MRNRRLGRSSNEYLLNIEDIIALENSDIYDMKNNKVVILLGDVKNNQADTLVSGREILEKAKLQNLKYINAYFVYYTKPLMISIIVQLIKVIKRKSHIQSKTIYRTTLSNIIENDLPRGIRTRENAYNWNNKKWKISPEEREKRYNDLYNSLKNGNYDFSSPMLIALNRQLGYKDKLLQGHHRIGGCQELGIEEVSVSFWAYPQTLHLGL